MSTQDSAEADFDAFVAARSRALMRTAWLLTGDEGTAEDLVQTALIETWRRWSRVGGMLHAEAYVRRIVVTSFLRDKRRRRVGETLVGEPPELAAPAPPESTDVRRALADLPRAQRAVLVLRYYEDWTEAQTAELLGIGVGTVKSHTARALARLRTTPALAGHQGQGRS